MQKVDLQKLSARESEQVEWKLGVADVDDVLRTITAFANDYQNLGGGYIVCGAEEVTDEYGFQRVRFPGLTASKFKEIEGKVMADAVSKIVPPVTPLFEEIPGEQEGCRVLVFIIPSSSHSHSYRASGKDASTFYVRIGRSTIEARNGILRELMVRKGDLAPWDYRLCEKATLEDIDLFAFREVLQTAQVWNPSLSIEDYFSESLQLSALAPSLGGKRPMTSNQHPRNFSILLFGKEPTRFFPGAWTKVSFYPGKDRSDLTSERHELMGSIAEQAKKAIELLKIHSSTAFDKESSDPNIPKYPLRALQEAVINAIVHRDYEVTDPTSITVFSNRIEILSPGGLPRTIDRQKFLEGKAAPSWRNRTLAFFFNKLQLAQAEGQGIPTILRLMKELGSPNPMFDLDANTVTCVLPAHPRHELMRQISEVQRLLVQQDIGLAMEQLESLTQKHSTAPQILDLLLQISKIMNDPQQIGIHIRKHRINHKDLPASTLFNLATALTKSPDTNDRELANQYIKEASNRKLESSEIRSAFLALRELGHNEKAIQLINKFIHSHNSTFAIPPNFYDMRARAKIDLAKKCMDTGRSRHLDRQTRAKAWDQCRSYLNEAESDILKAIQTDSDDREKEYYERDLDFVRQLQAKAQKSPETKKNGNNK